MAVVLTLICQGSTAALKRSYFPDNEPMEDASSTLSFSSEVKADRFHSIWHAPQLAAIQTAAALGLVSNTLMILSDLDYGEWAGFSTESIMTREPRVFAEWLNGSSPPNGESLEQLISRCDQGLAKLSLHPGNCCVIASQAVIRGIVIAAMKVSTDAFKHIGIDPLSLTELSFDGNRWQIRQTGARNYIRKST